MYILFTGAPGSKWSSVVKNIYWSDDIDHTDYSEDRTYYHDADTPGNKHLMHIEHTGIQEWSSEPREIIGICLSRAQVKES